jgi:hypothetical protein
VTLLFQMVIHEAVLTMDGDGPGQPYLDLMERHEAGEHAPCPWQEPDGDTDPERQRL